MLVSLLESEQSGRSRTHAALLPSIRSAQQRRPSGHESRRLQQYATLISGGNEMTISTIDESQRKAARVAGFAYLFIEGELRRPTSSQEVVRNHGQRRRRASELWGKGGLIL